MENTYSLWVLPSAEVCEVLQEIITNLSHTYHSPFFEPHMTLLGNVLMDKETMIQKAQTLAETIKPFPLTLSEVSFSTTYFQSIFVRLKATPALMNANLLAKKVFDIDNYVYMPHISLLYGDHAMEERESIASEVVLPKDIQFVADNLIVVPSTSNPHEWTHLAEFSLQ